MYKLTLGSINYIKASTGYSGTIETDRVVIVDSDGKYLQVDGNWGTELKNGLVRTYSATLDVATTDLLKAKYTAKSADTAAVYVWDGKMVLQSAYASVDAFIESLVDGGEIIIQGYTNPQYELSAVTIKTAGAGYTQDVVVEPAGQTGDTKGAILAEIDDDAQSETYGQIKTATITKAGTYESPLASLDLTVPGGTTDGVLTVTMAVKS